VALGFAVGGNEDGVGHVCSGKANRREWGARR